jgi:predicted branched-subunit amino acid permease
VRAGIRAGLPFAVAAFVLALSFGVVAGNLGMPGWAAILMSAVVFAGSAQFAALSIVAQGGGLGAAVAAAALVNSRFLPMGIALAPSLPGGPLARAAQGQAVVDASFVLASDGEGGFDRDLLLGSTAIQYLGWVGGTIAGVLGGGLLDDAERFGLDAVYPAFFLALLIEELRAGRSPVAAALGGLIAFALVPIAPPGVPVLVASLAALWGLRQ